jgi:hypothetical protein
MGTPAALISMIAHAAATPYESRNASMAAMWPWMVRVLKQRGSPTFRPVCGSATAD